MSASNNSVKGKLQFYMEQARDTPAAIGALLLIAAGLQLDGALSDHPTVASMLSASNDEATFTGYARKILPNPVVTVDNTNDRVLMSIAGTPPLTIRWDNAGGAAGAPGVVNNQIGKVVIYYDPNPGSSTDADLVWLTAHDAAATTDGTHLVITLDLDGLVVARKPT